MKRCLIALGCLAGLLVPAPVEARTSPVVRATPLARATSHRAPIRVVLLVERGEPGARATLVAAFRAQLARRKVPLDVLAIRRFATTLPVQLAMARRAAALREATVVVWLSLTRPVPLFVYFAGAGGGRLMMRSFGELEADERAEAAAIVVRSAVLAYRRGERPGREVAALPPSLEAPPVPAARRPAGARAGRMSLELGYGYAYDDWDARLTGLHNLQVQVALRLHPRWSLLAGYQWSQPVILADPLDRVEVQLRPHRFALGVRLGFPRGRWDLGATLWVAAELVDYVVRDQPLVTDRNVRPLLLFSVIPCFHAGLRLFHRLRLVAELGLEVELRTPTLQLAVPTGAAESYGKLGRPEVVRPRMLVALAVDLF